MTSNLKENDTDNSSTSSEDECLSTIKKKIDTYSQHKSIEQKDENSLLVEIKIEEIDASENNTSQSNDGELPSKRKKKFKRKIRPENICVHCCAVFYTVRELKKHNLTHQEETRHYCAQCKRYFKKAFSLKLHQQSHEDIKAKCPLCDSTFNTKINLGRHLMRHEKTEKCEKCPAKFHTQMQLESHLKTHTDEQNLRPKDEFQEGVDQNVKTIDTSLSGENSSEYGRIKQEVTSDGDIEDVAIDKDSQRHDCDNIYSRDDLTYPTQAGIVSKMHKGRSVSDICRLYGVTPEIVNEIWEDRDQYKIPKKLGKKGSKYLNKVLDAQLVEWFNNQTKKGVQVSGKMVQDAAEHIAKDCGFLTFNGSRKWLERFKKRHNIKLRKPSKPKIYDISMDAKWKREFFKEQWCDASMGFANEDIYTGDEVGLYYNPSKGRIKKYRGKKFVHGYSKDRLSIFMCANMTGTDKKKLFVCGTEDPFIHSYRNPDTLPVTYIRHSQGYFTTTMFEEFVKYWNNQLVMLNKKAILILDRATIHSKLLLPNLKLVFVPWKASTGLIPIKNGIYNRFRDEFRRLILEEKAMNAIRGIDRSVTCLEALNMLDKAWERTPGDVITESFKVTGYEVKDSTIEYQKIEKPKVNDNDEEMLCEMLKNYDVESYYTDLTQLDQYLTVDEEVLTGQGTNVSVFGGNHRVEPIAPDKSELGEILPIASDRPETSETENIVKNGRALEDLEIVRKYLQSVNTSYETYCAFMDVEKFVLENAVS